MSYTIRKATIDDCPVIAQLLKMLISDSDGDELKTQDKTSLEADGFSKGSEKFQAILAESDDKEVVGLYMFSYRYISSNRLTTNETSVYVRPKFRGQGIGSALLKTAIQECLNRDCVSFSLTISSTNLVSQQLHRKLKPKCLTDRGSHLMQISIPKFPRFLLLLEKVRVEFCTLSDYHDIMRLMKTIDSVNEKFTGIRVRDKEYWKSSINGETEMKVAVAKIHKKVIGCISFVYSYCNHLRSIILLDRVVVDKLFRNRGIGQTLINFCLNEGERTGSSILQSLVHIRNAEAMALMKRCRAVDTTTSYGWLSYHATAEHMRQFVKSS